MEFLNPELLLSAYTLGLFPMANDRDDPTIHWIDPIRRGIIPLDEFHIPRRLRRTIRRNPFELRVNSAFRDVIESCAAATGDRPRTWLNDDMIELYVQIHKRGYGHSIECWQGDQLVGGLYGLAIGGAFFGESMFSRERDASKLALVDLVERLRFGGFRLLDTQFVTHHLRQFGAIEINRTQYRRRLRSAIAVQATFPEHDHPLEDSSASGSSSRGAKQSKTQMS